MSSGQPVLGTYAEGELALVVGAAGGTGLSICRALAGLGLGLVVADIDGPGADRVRNELASGGTEAESVVLDVADGNAVDAAVGALEGRGLAVLVNLAATVENRRIVNMTNEQLERTLHSHLVGTLNTVRAVAPGMSDRGYGRIVNMSSIVVRGAVGAAAYGAAKGAVEAFSRTAALELATRGVTVNCVSSGPIATGVFLTQPEENQKRIVESIPVGRAGQPEELAATVAFLASPRTGYLTGQSIVLCGGLSLGF